ncbi:MAG: hypothetical protein Tsb008_21960 [Rhodothalassiaceae bacterium]
MSRRHFGKGLVAVLTLAALRRALLAHGEPREVEVRIARFAFAPDRIEIPAGERVSFVNDDYAPHTATARDGTWDTGTISRGEQRQVLFETPGEYAYYCSFHPHMAGLLVVRDKAGNSGRGNAANSSRSQQADGRQKTTS